MKYGYIYVTQDNALNAQYRELVTRKGCDEIFVDNTSNEKLRPEWVRLLSKLGSDDEVYVAKLSNVFRTVSKFCYFCKFLSSSTVRFVSILDHLDTADTTPKMSMADVAVILGTLTSEIGKNRRNTLYTPVVSESNLSRRDRHSSVLRLYSMGIPVEKIMEKTGYSSKGQIYNILKKYKISTNRNIIGCRQKTDK